MKINIKTVAVWLLMLGALFTAGYGAYRLYNYLVEDATKRIKKGAAEGVSEGIGEGIGSTLNPITWPKKLLDE